MLQAVIYNIASFEALVKHKYRSSLSIPLTNFLVFHHPLKNLFWRYRSMQNPIFVFSVFKKVPPIGVAVMEGLLMVDRNIIIQTVNCVAVFYLLVSKMEG